MKKVGMIDAPFKYDAFIERMAKQDTVVEFAKDKSEEALIEFCKDKDVLCCTFTKVTAAVLNATEHCSMIIRTGIGVDNIDVAAASAKGIKVCFVPDYCREEVADHTVTLLLSVVRRVCYVNANTKEHWDMKNYMGYVPRLSHTKAGILSFGAIGKMIAKRLQSFGISVMAYDPYLPVEVFEQLGVERAETDKDIFKTCDFTILTGPLTPERFHIINDETIDMMVEHPYIINTARGPLVDEDALIRALRSGRIAGAGFDVFEHEPITNPELYTFDNLVISPHMAYYSVESSIDLREKVFDEIERAIRGEKLRSSVN